MADHYFSDHPDSRSDIREISYGLGSISMRFLTDHGVFSISRVDHGTDLVLKTVLKDRLTAPESVLDMGCGYGPIGLTWRRHGQHALSPCWMSIAGQWSLRKKIVCSTDCRRKSGLSGKKNWPLADLKWLSPIRQCELAKRRSILYLPWPSNIWQRKVLST